MAILLLKTNPPARTSVLKDAMRSVFVVVAILSFVPRADADTINASSGLFATQPTRNPWNIDWLSLNSGAVPRQLRSALTFNSTLAQQSDPQPVHAVAIEHSEAYQRRGKIHKYASFATIPLFAGELALGQSLYNGSTGNKGLHVAVGSGIIGLFAANAVTGLWNLLGEDRQQPEGRTLRITHSLLMLAANAGFVATWATGPHGGQQFDSDKATHRDLAIASISVGTVGYLLMLFGNR